MMKKKIAYIINHISFFDSHISPIAIKASKKFNIEVFSGISSSLQMDKISTKNLKKKNIKFTKSNFHSSGENLFTEFLGFLQMLFAVKKFNPDLIHCATPKGILYGGLIARILNIKSLVIFNTGMGFLYSNKLSFFQKILLKIYSLLKIFIFKHKNKKIVIENNHDLNFLKKKFNLHRNNFKLIKAGSGVDLNIFHRINISKNKIVILPARVLKEKGILEFVEASKILKSKYSDWKFYVVGSTDYMKKSSFTKLELNQLKNKKYIKFLGYRKNIIKIYKKSAIVCLPSYREGLSKSLLEASSLGIPIVTTNAVGCKDAIIPGVSGELCKTRDVNSLVKKLELLIKNKKKRLLYGKNARKIAEKNYGIEIVIRKNVNTYLELIGNE